jgi:hypothetical protein
LLGLGAEAERTEALNRLLGKWAAEQLDVTRKISAVMDHGSAVEPWLEFSQLLVDCPASQAGVAELLAHETKQAEQGDEIQRATLRALGALNHAETGDVVSALIYLHNRSRVVVIEYLGRIRNRILECKRKLAADEVWSTFPPDMAERTEYAGYRPRRPQQSAPGSAECGAPVILTEVCGKWLAQVATSAFEWSNPIPISAPQARALKVLVDSWASDPAKKVSRDELDAACGANSSHKHLNDLDDLHPLFTKVIDRKRGMGRGTGYRLTWAFEHA